MAKTSIGELKLSPVKENGKFVFFNDFITINGKVSKGDNVKIFVDSYQPSGGKYLISAGRPSASMLVRGQEHLDSADKDYVTIDEYYNHVTEVYKQHFYFAKKV